MRIRFLLPILLLALIFSSCQTNASAPPVSIESTSTTSPILPTFTTTPTITPQPTATRTTQQALDDYTIAGLRNHNFQSGDILIRDTLLENEHFTSYLIQYPSDGLIITGILQIPKSGNAPFPVIVMNHGFFSRTVYQSGDGTDRAAEYLNKRGYLTVSTDYRSWGKSDEGESLFYSGLVIDVINLMNAIPSIPEADAERIGMWGHSMGGGTTLKVLTVDQRVKAAVLYSTVSGDFADLIERWGPGCLGDVYEGELAPGCNSSDVLPYSLPPDLTAAYFDAVDDPEFIAQVSPNFHLDYVTAPVQIHYGTKDGLTSAGTPPEWSKKIYEAFKLTEKSVQIYGYQDEGHSFSPDHWFPFMERSAQFFDKYVRP